MRVLEPLPEENVEEELADRTGRHDSVSASPPLHVPLEAASVASARAARFEPASVTRIRRSDGAGVPTSGSTASASRIQRSDVIRRELDPGLRDALVRQRGMARGIGSHDATRDVERSAGLRKPAAPDPAAVSAAQIEKERRAAERAELQGRFTDPKNVAARAERAEAERQRAVAALAMAQQHADSRADWETVAAKQLADREKIIERRETLVLQGLDDALMLNHPELRDAAAAIMPAADAFDFPTAERAITTAERCFAEVRELVETVDDLRTRFAQLEKLGIGAKKQRIAGTVRTGLAARVSKPWAEFQDDLPAIEASVKGLEATRERREEQEGAAGERHLAETAENEFKSDPKKETLQAQIDRNLIGRGEVTRTYRSSYDTGPGEFSVEVTIRRLKSIVIHAHCEPDGTPKPGNGTHWKYFTERKMAGRSHPMTNALITALVDKQAAKAHRDKNPALRGT